MKILILTNGNSQIGLGHIVRCIAIAKGFQHHRVSIEFLINDDAVAKKKVAEAGFNFSTFTTAGQIPEALNALSFDLIFSDSNELIKSELLQITSKYKVVNIAVQGDSKWFSHISFLHSPFLSEPQPPDAIGKILKGPEYAPLNPKYAELKQNIKFRVKPQNLLVSMGGGDMMGYTLKVVGALKILKSEGFKVSITVGAAYNQLVKLKELLIDFPFEYQLYYDLPDLSSLLISTDLAILSMGTTTYEACCLGVPSINICPSEFHAKLGEYYQKEGLLISLGRGETISELNIASSVKELLQNADLRRKIHYAASKKVDGKGISRIINGVLYNSEFIGNFAAS